MNNRQLKYGRDKKRLLLSGYEFFEHYFSVIIMMIFVIMSLFSYAGLDLTITFLITTCVSFFLQYRLLRFREFYVKCNMVQLEEALKRTANEMDWVIEISNQEYFQAYSDDVINFYGGGNLITIIKTDNGFLINSISDPRKKSIPFITVMRRENILTFVKHLKDVLNLKVEDKSYLEPAREWTIKKTIFRIIAYPFCMLIIYASMEMITNPYSAKSFNAGIFGLLFGIGYPLIDLIMIYRRIKARTCYSKH